MLVKLYDMEDEDLFVPRKNDKGLVIKPAYRGEKKLILDFVKKNFEADVWPDECDKAINSDPVACFIAVKKKKLVGFSCYDSAARGFFGPMGVKKEYRGIGIGALLLKRALFAMKENGYAYAIIGWVATDAIKFYEKSVNASIIDDSPCEKSVYRNMIGSE
ncbi:MAG: GNAT family N-acetyltransferase [Treponema sp.]|jgi:ribosomal protein S18 acetylase RimI-like enzyme|nr:GNAT family N-acetyltransferase [Treponema sp.]